MNWGCSFGEGLSDDRWLLLVRADPHRCEWKREGQENKNEQHVVVRGHREGTRSEPNTFDIQRQTRIHLQIEFTVQCWIIHEINDIKRVFGWDAPQSHGSVSESLTESQRSECELKVVVVMRSETTFILKLSSAFRYLKFILKRFWWKMKIFKS